MDENKKLRSDVDRLFEIMATLTDKVDRLSIIVGTLAENMPEGFIESAKDERR